MVSIDSKATNMPIMEDGIKCKFDTYPLTAQLALMELRGVIFQVAKSINAPSLIETLKWGQLSYLTPPHLKQSSTVRIDWQPNNEKHVRVYFICNTLLVETFKELYPNTLSYEKNRAIILDIEKALDTPELRHCIAMSLNYHKIKHLPLLGN